MKRMNRYYFTMMLTFLVLLLGYLSYEILRPFLYPIAWAIVLSILFYPVYAFLLQRTRLRNLSALVTLGLVPLTLIVPAAYRPFLLGNERGSAGREPACRCDAIIIASKKTILLRGDPL